MLKSDREMKNNSIHHSNLLKPLSNAPFANVFPGLAILSERKNTPLEGFETHSKVKLHVRCDLHPDNYTTDLSFSETGHLLKRNFNSCSSKTFKKRQKSHHINNFTLTNKKFNKQLSIVSHCWKITYNL